MQKELILSPIVAEGTKFNMTTRLGCDFKDGSERVIITNQWNIVRGKPLSSDEVLLEFIFTPYTSTHTLKWDSEINKAQDKAMELLKRHPQLSYPGNTNLKNPMFKMTNSRDEKVARVMQNKKKLMICNIINNMELEKVRDVAFWNRVPNASQMDEWDLCDKLINLENGVLMKNPQHFFDNYKLENIDLRVLAEKAIALKVITERSGFLFYGNNTQLGKTIEDVIDFIEKNKQEGEYLRKDVLKKDNLPADWTTKTVIDATIGVPTILEQLGKTKAQEKRDEDEKMDELKSQAKSLGIQGTHLMKEDTLIAKIAEAEKKLSAVTT